MYHFGVTDIYIYFFFHSILNPMSLSILGSIHHQFYPSLIAQSITYKSKLANHYIYKKIIFLGKKKKKNLEQV